MATKRNSSGQFIRGKAKSAKRASRRPRSMAMTAPQARTIYRTRSVGAPARKPARGRRRHDSAGGGPKLVHVIIAGLVLGYASTKGPKMFTEAVDKLPGAKTFGRAAVVGAVALGVDRYAYKNKYLKAIGYAGVAIGALQLGAAGTDFKFVGDAGGSSSEFTGDIVGDESDLGYDPDEDDEVGDYED